MPRNVLFLITDQQRHDTLGCAGNAVIRTPHLDALAARGVRVDRAYCESPICMPSRCTLATGLRAAHHGVRLHCQSLSPRIPTFYQELADAGWRTHAVGKLHLQSQEHAGNPESLPDYLQGKWRNFRGPYYGFQTIEMALGHTNPLVGAYGEWLAERHPEAISSMLEENLRQVVVGGQGVYDNDIPETAHSSAFVADRAIAELERRAADGQPFFTFASFPDPHWPIMPPPRWFHMYDDAVLPPPTPYCGEAERQDHPAVFRRLRQLQGRLPYDGGGYPEMDPAKVAASTRAYYGSISFIDHQVGRILDRLRTLGLERDTVVIFTADHGEYMGSHGLMAKGGYMYESFIRVPFLVSCPGSLPEGATCQGMLSFPDLIPSLSELIGHQTKLGHDGTSQVASWRGGEPARTSVDVTHFSHDPAYPDLHALVRDDGSKLVEYPGDAHSLVYDLASDPHELDNLATRRPGLREELRGELLATLAGARDRQAMREQREGRLPGYGRHITGRKVWGELIDRLPAVQS